MEISNVEISNLASNICIIGGRRERESACVRWLIVAALIKRDTGGIMSRVKRNRITFACLNPRVGKNYTVLFSLVFVDNSYFSSSQVIVLLHSEIQ